MVSIIHVSNETGAVNPIKRISAIAKSISKRVIVHSDGVQAVLKTETPPSALGVDFYSASAHKLGAPKGIGLLYKRRGVNIAPFICGGGQEHGFRSGTQNTAYIDAFAAAVSQFESELDLDVIGNTREAVAKIFENHGCRIIGSKDNSGFILCVCVPGVKAEILQNMAFDNGIVIGKGAACSGAKRGNRVLSAMGLSEKDIECCIRISFFVDTKQEDAVYAAEKILKCAELIRSEHVG